MRLVLLAPLFYSRAIATIGPYPRSFSEACDVRNWELDDLRAEGGQDLYANCQAPDGLMHWAKLDMNQCLGLGGTSTDQIVFEEHGNFGSFCINCRSGDRAHSATMTCTCMGRKTLIVDLSYDLDQALYQDDLGRICCDVDICSEQVVGPRVTFVPVPSSSGGASSPTGLASQTSSSFVYIPHETSVAVLTPLPHPETGTESFFIPHETFETVFGATKTTAESYVPHETSEPAFTHRNTSAESF